ncbi:MAG: phenylphosphate carboxylase subunit gamma, partial [Alphaproteobacteria bacterium]|nr:phenylphosphate carboxylase subunit gamma [Alphaproteobacteria bacterium]
MSNKWEVFVMDLDELVSEDEMELSIRTLNDGTDKYTYKRVNCRVSDDTSAYPDHLQVRFGRGQLAPKEFSI